MHLAEQVAAAARERASLAEQHVQQMTDAAEERRGLGRLTVQGGAVHVALQVVGTGFC